MGIGLTVFYSRMEYMIARESIRLETEEHRIVSSDDNGGVRAA